MKERTLKIIALLGTVVGLVLLLFLSSLTTIDSAAIDRISLGDLDKTVKVDGVVVGVDVKEKLTIVSVMQQNEIDAVLFTSENVSISEGDDVSIVGTVSEYNGDVQIIGEEVRIR